MNEKVDSGEDRLDSLKLGLAAVLLGGAIVAFYYFEDQSPLLRVLGLLAVVAISVFIGSQTATGRRIMGFISGAQTEVRRVVWPTRAETTQTTLAVLVIVMILGVMLWLFDMVLLKAVQILTGQGG